MPGDPKECRFHAANCLQLAEAASSPEVRRSFLELAQHWNRIAVELEDAQALLDALNQVDLASQTKADRSRPSGEADKLSPPRKSPS
jgi:hypothetical protein